MTPTKETLAEKIARLEAKYGLAARANGSGWYGGQDEMLEIIRHQQALLERAREWIAKAEHIHACEKWEFEIMRNDYELKSKNHCSCGLDETLAALTDKSSATVKDTISTVCEHSAGEFIQTAPAAPEDGG